MQTSLIRAACLTALAITCLSTDAQTQQKEQQPSVAEVREYFSKVGVEVALQQLTASMKPQLPMKLPSLNVVLVSGTAEGRTLRSTVRTDISSRLLNDPEANEVIKRLMTHLAILDSCTKPIINVLVNDFDGTVRYDYLSKESEPQFAFTLTKRNCPKLPEPVKEGPKPRFGGR